MFFREKVISVVTVAILAMILGSKIPEAKASSSPAASVSIYKNGVSLIKKWYTADLQAGLNRFKIPGIPTTLIPESLFLQFGSQEKELYFQEHLFVKEPCPLIYTSIISSSAQTQTVITSYLATGLPWKAHYSVALDPYYETVDLNGWIELINGTGTNFHNAQIQLLSLPAPLTLSPEQKTDLSREGMSVNSSVPYSYRIPFLVEIERGEIKYVNWVQSQRIQAQQDYRVFVGGNYLGDQNDVIATPPIETWISFENKVIHGLGRPLPAGQVTIYHHNATGNSYLLGVSNIPHTNALSVVSFKIPMDMIHQDMDSVKEKRESAPQISCELQQTDFKKLSKKIEEAGYILTLKNQSNYPRTIQVILDIPKGVDWTILRENNDPEKMTSNQVIWAIAIAPRGQSSLSYRLRLLKRD